MAVRSKGKKISPVQAKTELWLTGTPIIGKPIDFFPILERIDPEGLGRNWVSYVRKYCGAVKTPFGMDVSGATNLDELQVKLRQSVMIRRMKSEVLKDLPPKLRQVVMLPNEGLTKALARELSAVRAGVREYERLLGIIPAGEEDQKELDSRFFDFIRYLDTKQARGMKIGESAAFADLAVARKELALAKLPMAIAYIDALIETGEKVIVFAHHIAVAEALAAAWPESILITGKTPVKKRQGLVDTFQDDAGRNPIIGNFDAMGVGYTLTAATHVVCVELIFNASKMEQAEDRAHRIGQFENLTCHWLVVDGSFDSRNIEILLDQQEIIGQALDMRLSDLTTDMVNAYS